MVTRLNIKVLPGASRPGIAGWLGTTLKVKVAAPPEKGKANRATETLLCKVLDQPKNTIRVVAGFTSRQKIVEIDHLTFVEIRRLFAQHDERQ